MSWLVRDFKFNSEREGERGRQRKAGKQATVAAAAETAGYPDPQGALDTSVPGILIFYSSRAKHNELWEKLVIFRDNLQEGSQPVGMGK